MFGLNILWFQFNSIQIKMLKICIPKFHWHGIPVHRHRFDLLLMLVDSFLSKMMLMSLCTDQFRTCLSWCYCQFSRPSHQRLPLLMMLHHCSHFHGFRHTCTNMLGKYSYNNHCAVYTGE